MQKNSKYLELSVSGKWISLARLWLVDNAPCSRETMFVELSVLMPGTVRKEDNALYGPVELIREAYRRIYGTKSIPENISKPSFGRTVGPTSEIRRMLQGGMALGTKALSRFKSGRNLVRKLISRGEAVRRADGLIVASSPKDYATKETANPA